MSEGAITIIPYLVRRAWEELIHKRSDLTYLGSLPIPVELRHAERWIPSTAACLEILAVWLEHGELPSEKEHQWGAAGYYEALLRNPEPRFTKAAKEAIAAFLSGDSYEWYASSSGYSRIWFTLDCLDAPSIHRNTGPVEAGGCTAGFAARFDLLTSRLPPPSGSALLSYIRQPGVKSEA